MENKKKNSWTCTLFTQISLCFALYLVVNFGRSPTTAVVHRKKSCDFYFLTVRGGYRAFNEQTHLLNQIEKVISAYKVGFVINVSEFGERDPLLNNATQHFHSPKVPWYTTRALKGQEQDYFLKRIKTSCGKTLDIIALDTESLQEYSSGSGSIQFQWLTRVLKTSKSDWRIAVGFHPLFGCLEDIERKQAKANENLDLLKHILSNYGVGAYLSGKSCDENFHLHGMVPISTSDLIDGGPYLTSLRKKPSPYREIVNRFLLHRVSPLKIVTYAVTYEWDILQKSSVEQMDRDVM